MSADPWPRILHLVAHQLRPPTALLAGYTDLLASDEIRRDPERVRRILEGVRVNLRELNRLAAELQEGNRAAIGVLPIRRERVPIASPKLPRCAN